MSSIEQAQPHEVMPDPSCTPTAQLSEKELPAPVTASSKPIRLFLRHPANIFFYFANCAMLCCLVATQQITCTYVGLFWLTFMPVMWVVVPELFRKELGEYLFAHRGTKQPEMVEQTWKRVETHCKA